MRVRPGARALAPAAAAVLLLALAGCGDDAGPESASTDVGSAEAAPQESDTPSDASSEGATDEGGASGAGNDICALLTPAEVASVIGEAEVATDYVIGSREAPDGGQCAWADDPAGLSAGTSANLEVVVYRGTLAVPPDEAPKPGSDEVVTLLNTTYFATADAVYAIRVTGTKSTDGAALDAAKALVPAVQGRL